MEPLVISTATRGTAGILLLTIVLVETGGLYMYSIVRKRVVLTPFQQAFARAGHAHAGVLVILSLVVLIYADVAALDGLWGVAARSAVPLAAILMPVGFFLSSMGEGRTAPNRLVWLLFAGAVSLGVGVSALGLGLLISWKVSGSADACNRYVGDYYLSRRSLILALFRVAKAICNHVEHPIFRSTKGAGETASIKVDHLNDLATLRARGRNV